MHSHHLTFLREGLLIADTSTAILVRDILDVCRRFTSLVDRWGGDVLPEMLAEGSAGEQLGQLISERETAVGEISENLHELLSDFFRVLVDAQNPSAGADRDSSSAGTAASFSRTSRATQILQIQSSRVMSRQTSLAGTTVGAKKGFSKEVTDKGMDLEASMGRHLEQRELHSSLFEYHLGTKLINQVLLRLDFNGVLSAWRQKEDEQGQTHGSVLHPGGL